MENIVVSSTPHIRSKESVQSIMRDVIIALVPATVMGIVYFGMKALLLIAISVASSVLFEMLYQKITKKTVTIDDLSAVVTGLLLALNMPVSASWWMPIVGSAFAIIIAKQLFGGIGQNFTNPAIAGRVILLISFSGPMTSWMIPEKAVGGFRLVSGATPLAVNALGNTADLPSYADMFLGLRGGSLGETCILALLIGGIFLIVRGVIKPIIPVSFLGTIAVFALLIGQDPLFHLMAGGAVLGAFFMATDYVTSPVTDMGKLIFGIGCGLITMVIRVYGNYPEGVSFAILLMNVIAPHIDSLTKSKPFGGVVAK